MHARLLLPVAVACLISACAPHDPGLRVQSPAAPAAPADLAHESLTFRGAGVELYAQRWAPRERAPRAVVVIHHGLADHSDRYAELAIRLAHEGHVVWAFDMRGHGRSAGPRMRLPSADAMLGDLDAFMTLVRQREPGLPVFLYGHSFGGLLTCLYAIERQPDLAGLILAAPALAFEAPPLQAAALRTLDVLAPDLPAVPPDHHGFSRRREVVDAMNADPLIFQAKGPAVTGATAVDGLARIWAAPERLRVPLLVEHGTADLLTAPSGSRDLVARAGSSERTLRIHDGGYHDLLREPDGMGELVTDEIVQWIDARVEGRPNPLSSTPPRALAGDSHGHLLAVGLDVRGEVPRHGDTLDGSAQTVGLRLRLGRGRGGAGLGYLGGLDLRGGRLDGGVFEADAHLAGVALRSPAGALVALTGGVGVGGVRGIGATRAVGELDAEAPLGPLRVWAHAAAGWRLGGDRYADDAHGIADELAAELGLRLGRDRRYWGSTAAGAGPSLAFTYRNLGGGELFGVALGLSLWGGD